MKEQRGNPQPLGFQEHPPPQSSPPIPTEEKNPYVALVGAGPGAWDLLTLRAKALLRRADTVIADYLVPLESLKELGFFKAGARLIHMEKSLRQENPRFLEQIFQNELRPGKLIVRLKNGDPGVFGRLAEEIDFLEKSRVPWEAVPGVCSAISAATSAMLLLTRRRSAGSFAFVTAKREGNELNENLPHADNLVIFMGAGALPKITSLLLRQGFEPSSPACVIERSSMTWEKRVFSSLSKLPEETKRYGIKPPALLFVGKSVATIADKRPLLLFTGTDPSSFRSLGSLLHWPAQKLQLREGVVEKIQLEVGNIKTGKYDYLIFSDRQAVSFFLRQLEELEDLRVLAGCSLVAASQSVFEALLEKGLRADYLSPRAEAHSVAECLRENIAGKKALHVTSVHPISNLKRVFAKYGAFLSSLRLAKLVPHPELGRKLPPHDVIYFVSPSAVRIYANIYGKEAFQKEIWCMGEKTLERVRKEGFEGKVVPPLQTFTQVSNTKHLTVEG